MTLEMPPTKYRAKARKSRKKRKVFTGARYQDVRSRVTANSSPNQTFDERFENVDTIAICSTPVSKLGNKLKNSSLNELEESVLMTRSASRKLGFARKNSKRAVCDDFSMVDMTLLQQALKSAVICKHCQNNKSEMKLYKDDNKRHGLAETFYLQCSECLNETKFFSSKKSTQGRFEVNSRSVLACNALKGGRQVLANFCGAMNLPPPLSPASYAKHLKLSTSLYQENAERKMIDAANRLRKEILMKNPGIDKCDADGAVPVAVSVDGTWQKRGFTLKYGVALIVSIDTGEILDFEVLSLHSHECSKHQLYDKSTQKYLLWKENHSSKYQVNFEGPSGAMEGKGVLEMFKRSIDKRKLKYTQFIGNGDSNTFRIVAEEMKKIYGDRYEVQKEECIGHIQKRMGNALRTFKKDMKGKRLLDNKTVGGKGRLTKERINSM